MNSEPTTESPDARPRALLESTSVVANVVGASCNVGLGAVTAFWISVITAGGHLDVPGRVFALQWPAMLLTALFAQFVGVPIGPPRSERDWWTLRLGGFLIGYALCAAVLSLP